MMPFAQKLSYLAQLFENGRFWLQEGSKTGFFENFSVFSVFVDLGPENAFAPYLRFLGAAENEIRVFGRNTHCQVRGPKFKNRRFSIPNSKNLVSTSFGTTSKFSFFGAPGA